MARWIDIQINNIAKAIRKMQGRNRYHRDRMNYIRLSRVNGEKDFLYDKKNAYPNYLDYFDNAGSLDIHYFVQDIWAGRKVTARLKPGDMHYDIGSRVDGFIAHLLVAGIKVNMIDIRPLSVKVEGLGFVQGNATDLLDIPNESIMSLSSLHAIEHFGLGRYTDPIDPDGWKKALKSYTRVLARGGVLILSVPIGKRNILCFNSHRQFNPQTIVDALPELKLKEFSYIKDYEIHSCSIEDY